MKYLAVFSIAIWFHLGLFSVVEAQRQQKEKTAEPTSTQSPGDQQSNKPQSGKKSTTVETPPPQKYRGWEIAVVALERTKQWKDPWFGTVYRPKEEGQELVVVRVKANRLPDNKGESLTGKRLELYDVQDNKYGAAFELLGGTFPSYQFVFSVPEGTRFKTFQFEELSFNLAKLE